MWRDSNMALSYNIVSIGALSRNRFWNETEPRRIAHATTTLIGDENKTILVDPGLPDAVLAQRLDERTGLSPDQIDIVFLTNFRPRPPPSPGTVFPGQMADVQTGDRGGPRAPGGPAGKA